MTPPLGLDRWLRPDPACVGEARRLVAALLEQHGREDLADSAMLLESLVDDWGVTVHRDGKTVWFDLSHPEVADAAYAAFGEDAGLAGDDSATAHVILLDVPLLLHVAWQEHASALLREHVLSGMESDDQPSVIRRHAEATDALAILAETIPAPEVAMAPDRLMRDVTEPYVSASRVDLHVRLASVPHFAVLSEALDDAIARADVRLSTPGTQPEMRQLRSWLCGQVLGQAAGAPPQPWTVDLRQGPDPRADSTWDVASYVDTTDAVVVADDRATVVAVSPAAVELLQYDDPAELVGSRLLCIIPERYRQAHVAGFAMYFVNGRRPLLERAVQVPARAGDGTEVPVDLHVSTLRTPDGRQGFVATLRRR